MVTVSLRPYHKGLTLEAQLMMTVARVLTVAVGLAFARCSAATIDVVSPDGRNAVRVSGGEALTISVTRDGKTVLAPSRIALRFRDRRSGDDFEVATVTRKSLGGEVRTPLYKKASVTLSAETARVSLGAGFVVELVARNDGVAWRFATDLDGEVEVLDERADMAFAAAETELYAGVVTRLPSENTLWRKPDPLQHCYEQQYVKVTAGEVLVGRPHSLLPLPLTGRTPDGVWFCLKDTDVRDYPGWHLDRATAGSVLTSVFAREPDSSDVSVDRRHRWIGRRLDRLVRTSGRRTYPWRCVVLGDSPGALVESDILFALAEPATDDFDWVEPGLAAWDWWCGYDLTGVKFRAGRNTDTYLAFIDFAAEYGLPYSLVDGGWNTDLDVGRVSPEVDLPRVLAHAREKGVRIILWSSWASLYGRVDEMFAKYAAMGVAGFKIDYFDRDDAVQCRFLEETAKTAARHRLVVDYHGCQPPNGLQRTYPNILNWEGVWGLENVRWDMATTNMPNHDVRLAFTRFVAGPADYTPGAFRSVPREAFCPHATKQISVTGTRAHQMALYVVYEAPLQMLCDSPSQYALWPEATRFIASVPTVWDETRVLSGSPDDGGHVLIARRRGETWYVGALCGWSGATVMLDTAFLGNGRWSVDSFADGTNAEWNPLDCCHRTGSCSAGEKLSLVLAPGGGWVARMVRQTREFDKVMGAKSARPQRSNAKGKR